MAKLGPITECNYCGGEVVLTSNAEIYGKEYGKVPRCYLCRNCRASVGVHKSNEPLGILANDELKALKQKAHSLFDPYWKDKGWRRGTAYKKMATKLGIDAGDCHFGHFDKDMLLKAIDILEREGLWFK